MTVDKPSDREEEFFQKLDQKKVSQIRSDLDKKRAEEEREKRKEIHWMKCPKCGSDLKEINHQNVMIDSCTDCKGIWLDSGELNLLIGGQAQLNKSLFQKLLGRK